MHPSKKAQVANLKVDKALTKVLSKYADFADIFSPKLAADIPEYMEINDHAIELVDDQQHSYGPIYSLDSIELERLKTYIENNLASGFIKPFKSPARALILFDKKPDNSLRLCMDYQDFNNLIIKTDIPYL